MKRLSCLRLSLLATSMSLLASTAAMAHDGHNATNAASDAARTFTRQEIEQIVSETIMAHPEMIIQSIEQMQSKKEAAELDQMRQAVDAYKTSLYDNPNTPSAGNPKADVTIVEFFDYNCGYCKRSLPTVMKLLENDKNVRVIFFDFPVLSPTSETAAKAAIAFNALNPKKYFDFHSALFKLGGQFGEDNLASVAESMGVDKDDFLAKMKSPEVAKAVEDHLALGQKLGARGVPLFIIGKEFFPGAVSYETLSGEVARLREAQKK